MLEGYDEQFSTPPIVDAKIYNPIEIVRQFFVWMSYLSLLGRVYSTQTYASP